MVIRMKHTKGKRNRVRSHHALTPKTMGVCGHCKKAVQPHVMCKNCGYYGTRQVVDVLAVLDKKQKRKKKAGVAQR